MIEYYRLTTHETREVAELVTYLKGLVDETWALELTHHCLKEGEIWGAFKEEKLVGVGFYYPPEKEPLYISAPSVSIFVCPIPESPEVEERLREKLAY